MPKLSNMFPSRYIKADDLDRPRVLVIRDIVMENVSPDGATPEDKPVAYFDRAKKGLVLNRTNAGVLGDLFGDDTEAMVGRSVELYVDPTVVFRGERVAGLRLRSPAPQHEDATPPQPLDTMTQADVNREAAAAGDDIPF